MTLREDLRGVKPLDLACAVLMVPVILVGAAVCMQETPGHETRVPQETQVQEMGDAYDETWIWCGERFPYRDDLQDAPQIHVSKTP